jgi:hypothetical protein
MRSILLSGVALLFSVVWTQAQHKCLTMEYIARRMAADPSRTERLEQMELGLSEYCRHNHHQRAGDGVITIPVVVHVLWNTPEQNISDEQIFSQIEVLNEDFRLQNFDAPDEEHPFWYESQDTFIEFCLAQQDPDGIETDGINRVWTPVEAWDEDNMDDIKFWNSGGEDNWDPFRYLNIWVVELAEGNGTLGWATFPDELEQSPEMDGVVIRNNAFGYLGTVDSPNDLGRTATHEVGHWLFLRHIWGDEDCGDDFVADTPTALGPNYGCPDFPHNPFSDCGSDDYGEMYMNFMDYVDDNCMNMFTTGQTDRMYGTLELYRSDVLVSNGCQPGSAVGISPLAQGIRFGLYPNPSEGHFFISTPKSGRYMLSLHDVSGQLVYAENFEAINEVGSIELDGLAAGLYSATIVHETEKFGASLTMILN